MIKLVNISKYYHSTTSVACALRKVNLEFNKGEFIAITGESGSGKTTLLNIISGLDSYEEGEMFFKTKETSYFDAQDWERYRKDEIAFIFQNYNLIDSFTAIENVMVALIIEGYTYKDARIKAVELLKLVGLENHKTKRAIKLSGGQKQRLAIARALAKETDIIVADEPTGNLDAENGRKIMGLLKSISKDKLILIVTHNYEQANPYVTRKIRLHDGEVVSDENINDYALSTKEFEPRDNKDNIKKAFSFLFLNIKSQPRKSLIVFFLIFFSALASFVFIGSFAANVDDSKTKIIDSSIFINHDTTRLLVKTKDNSEITLKDINNLSVNRVSSYEKYDYITDINYFRPSDYHMIYSGGYEDNPNAPSIIETSSIHMDNWNHFMRSSTSLNESSISFGSLPTGNLEMVCVGDSSLVGTTETVYFNNSRIWGEDTLLSYEVTITGVINGTSSQAFFSEDLCQVMDLGKNNIQISMYYQTVKENFGYNVTSNNTLLFKNIYIDYSLDKDTIALSKKYIASLKSLYSYDRLCLENGVFKPYISFYQENKINDAYKAFVPLDSSHNYDNSFIGISKQEFDLIYDKFSKTNQFSLYIDDYAYTNDVISDLNSQNFQAFSCYKASVKGYDVDKVIARYITLAISLIGIILLSIVEIALCKSILKFKKNDYLIFKIVGMSNKTTNEINLLEILLYSLIASVIVLITALTVKYTVNNEYISDMFKYLRFYHYLIGFALNILVALLLGHSFGKYLKKRVKVTSLKED